MKINTYNNFEEMLEKEQNAVIRERLNDFYLYELNADTRVIDFNSSKKERQLQLRGVDVILTKRDDSKSFKVQEKITYKAYPSLLFEIEKASGKKGWAIDENELSNILIYYVDGTIYAIDFKELREYLNNELLFNNLEIIETDNKNVKVPIKDLKKNVKMIKYEFVDDFNGYERKLVY